MNLFLYFSIGVSIVLQINFLRSEDYQWCQSKKCYSGLILGSLNWEVLVWKMGKMGVIGELNWIYIVQLMGTSHIRKSDISVIR